jgi:hypothetical protein
VRCRGEEARGETPDLTNRNRVGGGAIWVSRPRTVKPVTTDRVRHVDAAGLGGRNVFLSGEACPGVGVVVLLSRVDDRHGDVVVRRAGVSRGRSTSGGLDTYAPVGVRAGKGRTSCREDGCGGW